MVWYSSRRRERFNSDWPRVRRMILERDGYACQWPVVDELGLPKRCLVRARQVDHRGRAVNGVDDDSPSNLWALCDYHHQVKTEMESAEQRRSNRDRRRSDSWYSHPAFKRV